MSKVTENTTQSAYIQLIEYKNDICPKYLLKNIDKVLYN